MNALQAGIRGLLQTLQGFALGGTLPRQHARGMPRELQPIVAGIDQLGDRLNAAYTELKQAMDRQSELAASLRTVVATRERQIEARTEELRNSVGTRSAYLRSGNCVPYRHARA